ncbi:hypothetical protein ACFSRY_14295 [Pontibacter locisalis]|uniref:Uncharacterized protein n=1 Tax=Pontibacter locisalis TaxID=1719035 RepID=A0ABW5IN87_9BACT
MKKEFKLEDLPKHNIYQVPDDYFDRLPTRVMERTAAANKPAHAWLPGVWRPLRLAVAPLILLLVFVGVYFFSTEKIKQPQSYALGSLAEQEIVDYLHNREDLETSDFTELSTLSDQEFTADFLNVSSTAAEEELEYYHLRNIGDTEY